MNDKKVESNYSVKYPEVENNFFGYINTRGKLYIRDKSELSFWCSTRKH